MDHPVEVGERLEDVHVKGACGVGELVIQLLTELSGAIRVSREVVDAEGEIRCGGIGSYVPANVSR